MKGKLTMLNTEQIQQTELLYKHFGKTELHRTEINNLVKSGKIKDPGWLKSDTYRVSRGVYSLPIDGNDFSPNLKDVPLTEEKPKTEKAPTTVTPTLGQAQVSDTGDDRGEDKTAPTTKDVTGFSYDSSKLSPVAKDILSDYGAGIGVLTEAFITRPAQQRSMQ